MGPAGAGSLAQVINNALANKGRFTEMKAFFSGVGEGHTAGVWEPSHGVPQDRPEFRDHTKRQVIKLMKMKKAEEMI
jgi:chlorophyllide a reductase subunit Y